MRPRLTRATVAGDHQMEVEYSDGLRATLDFSAYFAGRSGPVIDPLKVRDGFATARIDHGVLTWATGFDICPDVLRLWCERGRICSPVEMEAHFASHRPLQPS